MEKPVLIKMAVKHGWKFHDWQENIGMLSFVKIIDGDPARINIYTTKMTVATAINHPRKGKTQLYRKRVDKELMDKIFQNPRVHTHKGYRKNNKMKARQILFNINMIRALLDGSKTQTRRPINSQPDCEGLVFNRAAQEWHDTSENVYSSKFGRPGDLLYVRETFAVYGDDEQYVIHYHADMPGRGSGWEPSIHMPRWASRLTLEITDIRVERLQDISEEDAAAEGIEVFNEDGNLWYSGWMDGSDSWFDDPWKWHCGDPRGAFKELWDGIYFKPGNGWETNPWVWVTEFRVIHANVDEVIKNKENVNV